MSSVQGDAPAPGMQPIILLSIRGTLAPASLEAARMVHNQTAGDPAGVAAARALGDLSHMVYVPLEPNSAEPGAFLILDQWNNLQGLNQFFADPQVQQGGSMIFADRDPVVWAPAEGFFTFHCPAPYGQNERIVTIVRGEVHGRDEARALHNEVLGGRINQARRAGNLSHEAFFRLTPPGAPASTEFFAIDVWYNSAEMHHYYDDPSFAAQLMPMFSSEPAMSLWQHPSGDWVEW